MKRLITSASILLLLTGCVNLNKPSPNSDPKLPMVKVFKAYPDKNAIALRWQPVREMKGYYIQKFDFQKNKWIGIATIHNPYKSIYVDTNLQPNTIYKYRIATFNSKGIPSLAKELEKKTSPTISPIIPLEAQQIAKGIIKIIFRPHPNERVNRYIVEKYNDKTTKWEQVAILTPRLNVEFIDQNLKDGKIYKYRIFAKTYDGLISKPSKIIKVSTYPKPPIVLNTTASKNLPNKIIVKFSPVKSAIAYKIYISPFPDAFFKFYKKIKTTKFIDKINEDGYIRYYKVTAVSKYDTESLLDETPAVMGQTLPKPTKPIVSTSRIKNRIIFTFTSPDNRAVKYLIIKEDRNNGFKQKIVVKTNKFRDRILLNRRYRYEIYEVDKYGLISQAPAVVEVE